MNIENTVAIDKSKLLDFSELDEDTRYEIDSKGNLYEIGRDNSKTLMSNNVYTGVYGTDQSRPNEMSIKGNDLVIELDGNIQIRVLDYYGKNGNHVFKYYSRHTVDETDKKVDCLNIVDNNWVENYSREHAYMAADGKISSSTINTTNFGDIVDLSRATLYNYDGGTPEDPTDDKHWVLDSKGNKVYKININTNKGNDIVTGSRISDVIKTGEGDDYVIASQGGDTYTLGAGKNTLHYTRKVGGANDVVNLTKDEELTIIDDRLGNGENVMRHLTVRGNDVVINDKPNGNDLRISVTLNANITTSNDYLEEIPDTDPKEYRPITLAADRTFTFEWNDTDNKWVSQEPISTKDGNKHLVLNSADILRSKLFGADNDSVSMSMYSVFEGTTEFKITELSDLFDSYKDDLAQHSRRSEDFVYQSATESLFRDFGLMGNTVTIKDYAKGAEAAATVSVNGFDLDNSNFVFDNLSLDGKTFKGTRLDEVFDARLYGWKKVYDETSGTWHIEPKAGFRGVTITTGEGDNTVYGSYGDDKVTGGSGKDVVFASAGNNTYKLGLGDNEIHYTRYTEGADDVVNLTKGENLNVWVDRLGSTGSNINNHLVVCGNDVMLMDTPHGTEDLRMTIRVGANDILTSYQYESNPVYLPAYAEYNFMWDGQKWKSLVPIETDEGNKYLELTSEDILHSKLFSASDGAVSMQLCTKDNEGHLVTDLETMFASYKHDLTLMGTVDATDRLLDDLYYDDANYVLFKDYAKGAEAAATVMVNGCDLDNGEFVFDNISLDGKTFKGSRLNEVFDAREARFRGVTINTGEGYNKVWGSDGNDRVTGGSGDDVVFASRGNDTYKLSTGSGDTNKISYGNVDIGPVINTGNDTITLSKGETLDIDGFFTNSEIISNSQIDRDLMVGKCRLNGNDLILVNDHGGTITLKNFDYTGANDTVVRLNDHDLRMLSFGEGNIYKNALVGSNMADYIDVSDRDKGVSINSKLGNDIIFGSKGNDVINTGAGVYNCVTEKSGINKIVAGGQGNHIDLLEDSSNTVSSVNGGNEIVIDTTGKNTITTGNYYDDFTIRDGYNTINSGRGEGNFTIEGGTNKITTGIAAAGEENTFTITGGTNTITSKYSANDITVNGGDSNITTGAKNDTFTVKFTGNNNKLTLNGGAGDDTYDLSNAFKPDGYNSIVISDTQGTNDIIKLADSTKYKVFFDVTMRTDREGNAIVKSIGKDLELYYNDSENIIDDGTILLKDGLTKNGSIESFVFDGTSKSVDATAIAQIAQNVANWLKTNDFTSTMEVMKSDDADAIKDLMTTCYTDANIFAPTV